MATENSGKIDFNASFPKQSKVKIDENDSLNFAKQLLFWFGIVCVGVFIGFAIFPENKALESIFELIKIGALPLITLVISFYFPKSNG